MKKLLIFILVICTLLSFTACDYVNKLIGKDDSHSQTDGNGQDNGNGTNNDGGTNDSEKDEKEYKYLNFNNTEKNLFTRYIGAMIPFIPCDEYYFEGYYEIDDYENGIHFYTVGNTFSEYNAYLNTYAGYTLSETYTGEYGNTCYKYTKDSVTVDITYYKEAEKAYVDVLVSTAPASDDGGDDSGSGETASPEAAWRESYETITIDEAFDICDVAGNNKSDRYYLIATVSSVEDTYYGKMMIKDSTGELLVYGSYGADGKDRYGDLTVAVPKAGDVVLFYGNFMNYNGTREMYSGWIIDFYTPGQSGSQDNTGSGSDDNTGGDSGNTDSGSTTHKYNDFSSADKSFIKDSIGIVIPFIPCDEYYVEEYDYSEEGYSELGVNFYTYGNTEAEFKEYLKLFSKYTFDFTEDDEYGDAWYYYSSGDVMIDVAFYYYEGEYVVDLYAYLISEEGTDSGNTGSGAASDENVITNEGAGLPTDSDGVFDVDFTKAENVKNATDQGYYIDGCPTTGSPAVLVIPVEFGDSLASSKGYTTEALANAFAKGGKNDYYSVYDYYYISSYGKLSLDITVLDFWFKPKNNSAYYYNATFEYDGAETAIGDQLVMDEALAYLSEIMDLSKFDSDGNGIIDAVILVNTLDVGEEDFYWAYRYWNMYTDDEGYYYEYDGVSANDYIWASYQFLNESFDEDGNTVYNSKTMNTYTFIHEFAHILGADDYYDTEYINEPMAGCDIMDTMLGDHNPYTKINLGWITSSRLVVTGTSVTLTLEDFSKNGDTIIIANNWDEKLGAYQEYYVIMYYKSTGLNGGEAGYFTNDGIVVYHVNASLYKEEIDGETYYDIYNTNTDPSGEIGTVNNLIELVKSSSDTYVFTEGDTLPTLTDDLGDKLGITFVVVSLDGTSATVTFSAK